MHVSAGLLDAVFAYRIQVLLRTCSIQAYGIDIIIAQFYTQAVMEIVPLTTDPEAVVSSALDSAVIDLLKLITINRVV